MLTLSLDQGDSGSFRHVKLVSAIICQLTALEGPEHGDVCGHGSIPPITGIIIVPPPPPPLVSMNKVWQLAQNGKSEAGAQTLATIDPKLLEACRLTIANYIVCESTTVCNYAFKRENLFSQ